MALQVLERLADFYNENKISHVYLVETNNMEACLDDLKNVIKKISCIKNYKSPCSECNICNLIDQNYLPSLAIIEPEGNTIKKEQILELKRKFSVVPTYTKDNIYIIKYAEKMTLSAANTMLKFLEEPEDHIIGFFITSNLNNVIPTIRSRCEIIKALYDNHELNINSLWDKENINYLNIAYDYITKLEVEKSDLIMYNKSIIFSTFKEREDITKLFKIILIIYNEFLKNSLHIKNRCNDFKKVDFLVNFSNHNLLEKLTLITTFLNDSKSNVNLELLLDKFVIELSDING